MNRSGTSLTEQIICSHPEVYGAGELEMIVNMGKSLSGNDELSDGQLYSLEKLDIKFLEDAANEYLRIVREKSGSAKIVTDKMPHNFWHLPIISMMFPRAIVIHCTRNPVDTCLSNFFQDYGARHHHSNNLENLGNYYVQYYRLMQHWKRVIDLDIIDVRYESLVDDLETNARMLIDRLGLEWNDACLEFYKSKRLVTTASQDQVKQPIYRKSVARWRNYERHVQPLLKVFDAAGIRYE